MARTPIHTLDLNFQGRPLAIAAYMLEHSGGVALVESGPGSTIVGLEAALKPYGFNLADITHVFLTHIHLDHAGAAGSLAAYGAQIYVHPLGAAHMLNPEKLLSSAGRIYGDRMDSLWGEFLAVPAEKLTVLQDDEEVQVGKLRFRELNTPGHAEHHYCYQFEDLCFSGDVGAVRIPGYPYLRLPMPPPEFHLEKWRASVSKLQDARCKRVAPTHFGIYEDAEHHWEMLNRGLDEVEEFMQHILPSDPPVSVIDERFSEWTAERSKQQGLTEDEFAPYEAANPSWMSATGMQRYWKKYRVVE